MAQGSMVRKRSHPTRIWRKAWWTNSGFYHSPVFFCDELPLIGIERWNPAMGFPPYWRSFVRRSFGTYLRGAGVGWAHSLDDVMRHAEEFSLVHKGGT